MGHPEDFSILGRIGFSKLRPRCFRDGVAARNDNMSSMGSGSDSPSAVANSRDGVGRRDVPENGSRAFSPWLTELAEVLRGAESFENEFMNWGRLPEVIA